MEATINKDGEMAIKATTELEVYALRQFYINNNGSEIRTILFDCNLEPEATK